MAMLVITRGYIFLMLLVVSFQIGNSFLDDGCGRVKSISYQEMIQIHLTHQNRELEFKLLPSGELT